MAILVGAYRLSELTGNLLPSMAIDTEPLQEPVPVKQGGEGSNPFAPTNKIKHLQDFLVSAFFCDTVYDTVMLSARVLEPFPLGVGTRRTFA